MDDHISLPRDPAAGDNARVIRRWLVAVVLVAPCLSAVSVESVGATLSPRWHYWGLVPVTVLFALCLSLISARADVLERHLSIPSVLFLTVVGYFIYVGSLDHWLQVLADAEFLYLPTLAPAYQLVAFLLTAWAVGYVAGRWLSRTAGRTTPTPSTRGRTRLVWFQRRLFAVAIFWSVVSTAAFAVFYFRIIGFFPVLRGVSPNADSELRAVMFGPARLVSTVAFNAATLTMITSGLYIVRFERHKALMATLFMIAAAWFLLWGARLYIALPAMIVLVLVIARKRWSLRRSGAVLAGLAVLAVSYGLVRNRAFTNVDLANRTAIERLADLHIGPEFRDAVGVMTHLDALREQYKPASYFRGICFTAVPGRVLGVLGLDKDILFAEEGASVGWIAARTTRDYHWGAIRPGIVGETLMAFGPVGVIVAFALYGLLFARLDVLCERAAIASPRSLLIYGTAVILSYSVIASTHSTFAKFWYFIYGSLLTMLVAAGRARRTA